MKAAVVDAVGAGFTIAEVELAHPLGREVLIDVRASGLCHTDLTIAAAQALIHENQLVKIPVEMPFPQAALLGCGVVTGAGAVLNTARVRPGDTVAIIRAGGVDLNAVTAASLAGAAQIIAVDIHDATLQKALRFGATDVINSATVNPVEAVRELLPGGVDRVFDFVGLNEVTARALEMLTVGGALYLIGVSGPDSQVTVNLVDAVLRQPRVVGVNTGSTNFKRNIPLYSRMYLDGRLEQSTPPRSASWTTKG